jgi:spore coat protein CotH/Ca2+-binding EF-hand superfamily protein
MSKRIWVVAVVVACAAVGGAWAFAGPAKTADPKEKAPAKDAPGKDVFGLTKLHQMHLEFTAKEWERMQQVVGGMGGPGRGPGGPAKPPEPKPGEEPIERHKGSGFGMQFPWAHADLSAGGKDYEDIGIRYKGNFSYVASTRGLKRNFKIELDHYDADLRFHGLKTLNLNAGAVDQTKMREALSFSVFRAAGVPASRTAYAEVTLTVPGKYDKEYLGLYTMIEQVDKTFLKEHFKSNKGLLMKPEGLRGLEYLGEDWDKYKPRYQPKHEASKKEALRVIEFVRLLNRGTDEEFQKEIASYLEIDEFLRFVAVNAMLTNLDSFLSMGHNFYIYLNPDTNKFVFIPWDLDLSLGSFGAGSPDQKADLSLTHPYAGQNKLIDRLLAMKDVNEKYQKILKEVSGSAFTKEKLLADIDAIDKVTKEILVKEKKAAEARKEGGGGFGMPGGSPFGSGDIRKFVEKRTESVVAQADGKSKGSLPTGFGPGGPGGPGGFGMGNVWAKPLLEALDGDKDGKLTRDEFVAGVKKFFADTDKEKTGKLDEKQLAEGLNRIFPQPGRGGPGGPGGPGRGGPGGPGGGQGAALASVIVKRADTDKDGKVTLDELVAAAETLFKETDRDNKGKLDEPALVAAINRLMPQPVGPGGGRGFAVGGLWAKPLLEALDGDKDGKLTKDEVVAGVKKFFADVDKEKTGKLDEKQIAEGLNRIFPQPPGRGGPGGPGGGQGTALASAIVKRADADKDGKVTLDELVAAAEALFKEIDKDKKGTLDEPALAAAINLLMPPPAFPGGPGGRPGGFGVGAFWAKPLLEALDGDKDGKLTKDEVVAGVKKFFADTDKEKTGKLDEKQIAEGLNRIFPQPPGVGGPGAPPVAFGPGAPLASAIVKRAGADKDGKVTLDKLVAAAEALFAEIDKDKKGKLDEAGVAAAINLLMPPPPGFAPGGFGPPPERPPEAPKKEGER